MVRLKKQKRKNVTIQDPHMLHFSKQVEKYTAKKPQSFSRCTHFYCFEVNRQEFILKACLQPGCTLEDMLSVQKEKNNPYQISF